jgi:hypothetical protein
MLFCALMLVRNSRASLEQSVALVPLSGGAKHLVGEIMHHHTGTPETLQPSS